MFSQCGRGADLQEAQDPANHIPGIIRQAGQGTVDPLGAADTHQQQGEDHQRERRYPHHLGRDPGQHGLKDQAQLLQQGKEISADRSPDGIPPAKDGQG